MNVRAEGGVVVASVRGASNHGALVGMGGCGGVESGGNQGQASDEDEAAHCNDILLGSEKNVDIAKSANCCVGFLRFDLRLY
jgi:hypothetical protein